MSPANGLATAQATGVHPMQAHAATKAARLSVAPMMDWTEYPENHR